MQFDRWWFRAASGQASSSLGIQNDDQFHYALASHRGPDEELEKISTAVKQNNTGKFLLFSNPYMITKQLVYFARRKTQWRYSLQPFHPKVIIFRKSWTWLELSCLTYQPQHCGYFQIKENPCFVVNSNISFLIFKRMDTIIMIGAND